MNVLVIPEDFRKDQYILKPIVEAMLAAVGKPNARVRVCMDPLLGGVAQALNWREVEKVVDRYGGMVQLFLLIVDRDGVESRRDTLDHLEAQAREKLAAGAALLAENGWQELEVWALAGHQLPAEWRWQEVRSEVHSKERYFEPFAMERGLADEPGGGRKTLGREAARNYPRIRQKCVEDVRALEDRVRAFVEGR